MKSSKKKWALIAGLALGLPSTLLGLLFVLWMLYDKGLIEKWMVILGIVLVLAHSIYLMFYYASTRAKKDKPS